MVARTIAATADFDPIPDISSVLSAQQSGVMDSARRR
jgi:hypothetical protein